MLGELPVNRVNAYWNENQRQSLGNFGTTWYGKRACLHCFLNGDTVVLDSEWHWLFNCVHFHELRHNRPFLHETLKSIQRNKEFADICDLGNLFMMIQNDSRLGFSVASFIRQAILERKSWMSKVCVQCRPCTPPDHWNRNLFQHPPSVAEFPADFERTFTDGKPWFFYEHPLGQ